MFSMPPATATSMLPSAISCAAETMACAPDPQTRLTVSAGVDTGSPAWMAAWRAGFILLPACTTLPMTIVSPPSGRPPRRAPAAPVWAAPRSAAGTSLRLPPKVPIAVRTGSAKTTERCDIATAALFAIPTAAFSESGHHRYYNRYEGLYDRYESGRCRESRAACAHKEKLGEQVMGNCRRFRAL